MTKKILVVTADYNLGTMIEARLAVEDYDALTAADGEAGLAAIYKNAPDLVVLDAALPRMSGYQLVEALKSSRDEKEGLPIIVLSEREDFNHLFEDQDIHCFITKPVVPAKLFKQIRLALEKPVQESGSRRLPGTGDKRILLAGMHVFTLKKVKDYLESQEFSVDLGWNEEDVIKKCRQSLPALILLQYWEDPEIWDAIKVVEHLKKNLISPPVPLLIFCLEPLYWDVKNHLPHASVLGFRESPDLIEGLGPHLKRIKK